MVLAAHALPRSASQPAAQPEAAVTSAPSQLVLSSFARLTPAHGERPRPFANLTASCYINAGIMACFGVQSFREVLYNIYTSRQRRLDAVLLPAATHPDISLRISIQKGNGPRTTHEERLAVTFKAVFEPQAGMLMLPRLFT